jgi:4-amino-4-deoxy-L-arabinose transferase-like glycosyltransferase
VPIYLSQRHGTSVPTWLEPATLVEVNKFLILLFPVLTIVIVVLAWWVDRLCAKREFDEVPTARPLAGLFGLTFLFVPLLVISFAMQNVLLHRYTIAMIAGLAVPLTGADFAAAAKVLRRHLRRASRPEHGGDAGAGQSRSPV